MTQESAADDWMSRYQETLRRREALQPTADAHNKCVLMTALAAVGIARVKVVFDGYGDSGQIEQTVFISNDGIEVAAPVGEPIAIQSVRHDGSAIDTETLALPDAIEHVCYGLLGAHKPGWENNDGAYGDFVFDVAGDAVTYTHNSRWTQVDTDLIEI